MSTCIATNYYFRVDFFSQVNQVKVTYYGKTFHHFYTRVFEYMKISNLMGKRLKDVNPSVISDHILQFNCMINFDEIDVLAADSDKFKLLLRKSLLIKRDKPILNKTIKSRAINPYTQDVN